MPDCSYCEDSFEDEQAYLRHLRDDHEGELGKIDQRRVEEELGPDEDDSLPTGPIVLGVVLLVSVALVGYVIFIHGSGNASGESGTVNGIEVAQLPGDRARSAHGHGLINVTIAGQQVDFSQSQYQLQDKKFHFESGNGRIWHKHAPGVTLEYAMATLGIEVTENTVTFDGTTYRDSDPGTTVNVTVDGEPVTPSEYELKGPSSGRNAPQGDYIRIIVTTS